MIALVIMILFSLFLPVVFTLFLFNSYFIKKIKGTSLLLFLRPVNLVKFGRTGTKRTISLLRFTLQRHVGKVRRHLCACDNQPDNLVYTVEARR